MPTLFVAVDLPTAATAELTLIQPAPTPDLRLTKPSQMHLTLHYLGEAEVGRTAAALQEAAVPAFTLAIEGVGQFPSAGGAVTLWAGVRESAGLLSLHTAVAGALAGLGFQRESRRYTPHVTLARCGPGVPAKVIDEFLVDHTAFSLPPIPVDSFGLYSSAFVGDVPVYRREQSYPLRRDVGEIPPRAPAG